MTKVTADAPVFISYSRKDYYFAESLALHLLKHKIPAWLDVKDLNPGVFWERDLFAALEAAACVVVLASSESMRSPNVRTEMGRAVKQGKRIIVARFRGSTLADELRQCEVVDFRGAFVPALRDLIQRLNNEPSSSASSAGCSMLPWWPRLPLWVVAVVAFLSLPTVAYFVLADWGNGTRSDLLLLPLLLLMALGLCWLVIVSFLQRRMGMTRLAASLSVLGTVFALPVVQYFRRGNAGLQTEAAGFARATAHHVWAMVLLAAVPFLGFGLILLLRPSDLLRWTPTGKAWTWYRSQCAARVFAAANQPAAQPSPFFLLHDAADLPAAKRIRQSLLHAGWQERPEAAGAKTVLLLTNRTVTDWLLQQQARFTEDVMTVVATSICLPAQLDWLWKREWTDLRKWDVERLYRKEPLPLVPEAVTQPQFPASVRFAHHVLCALAALAFSLTSILSDSMSPSTMHSLVVIGCFAAIVLSIELPRRLLRRAVGEAVFLRMMWISWIAVLTIAAGLGYLTAASIAWIHTVPVAVFLFAFPIVMLRNRKALAFWFPSPDAALAAKNRSLASGRIWRTAWWLFAYAMLWMELLGMY
jgi:hypothetical protein